MGQAHYSLGQLIEGGSSIKIGYGKGDFIFNGFEINERVTFLDYIMGGCEINVHVCIDYTLSNGKPESPESLHYLNPNNKTN